MDAHPHPPLPGLGRWPQTRDPAGFARLRRAGRRRPGRLRRRRPDRGDQDRDAAGLQGRRIADITVGDCVELVDTQRRVHARGGQKKVDFYLRLRALGIFPADAPATHPRVRPGRRAADASRNWSTATGCSARRSATCSWTTCGSGSPRWTTPAWTRSRRTLAGLFWARIEALAPGIDTLRLPPAVARPWKEDLSTVKSAPSPTPDGRRGSSVTSPRLNAKDELMRVRALLPRHRPVGRGGARPAGRPWAVPCPISDAEISRAKERSTASPAWTSAPASGCPSCPCWCAPPTSGDSRPHAACRPPHDTPPGALIDGTDGTLRRAPSPPKANGRHVWAEDTATGKRRNLTYEEDEAFWAFAAIEVLRLTGIRCEELLELTHHSITEYRLPSHRRARPAAADRPVQDRHRTAAAGQPRTGRRPQRDRQPAPRPRAARSRWWSPTTSGSGSGTRRCRCCSSAASATSTGRSPPRAHPQAAHQRARRDRPDRRRRRPAASSPRTTSEGSSSPTPS